MDRIDIVSILQRYVAGEFCRQEVVDAIWSMAGWREMPQRKDFSHTIQHIYDLLGGPEIEGLLLTCEAVMRKIDELLSQTVSMQEVVDWAEDLLVWDVDYEDGAEEFLNEVLHLLANMDMKGFELNREDLKSLKKRVTDVCVMA